MKGAKINHDGDIRKPIINLLKAGLEQKIFDAVLIPMRIPSGESFAWILTQDVDVLDEAYPLPPVISVQGAKALSSLTRLGEADMKIATLMRPCEIRAITELNKLQQLSLDNISLFSIDCPGSLPNDEYMGDAEKGDEDFSSLLDNWNSDRIRDICQICDKFSITVSDIHIGLMAGENKDMFIIPNSLKGEKILEDLKMDTDQDLKNWSSLIEEISRDRKQKREEKWKEVRKEYGRADNLLNFLSQCIACHTCRSVCPICYCRQCYFESDAFKLPSYNYLERAQKKGSFRLPPDNLLFHLGRMQHMSMSCVSCGLCEDMCPMSIPISHLFSYVADKNQDVFDYVAGKDPDEPLPLTIYRTEELEIIPEMYTETHEERERKNA